MENFTTAIKHVHLLPLLLLPLSYNTHRDTHIHKHTHTRPSLSYFTNTLCIKMKEVNGTAFCKQNSRFSSLMHRLSTQYHNRTSKKGFTLISGLKYECQFLSHDGIKGCTQLILYWYFIQWLSVQYLFSNKKS